jgi:hypothetical protein
MTNGLPGDGGAQDEASSFADLTKIKGYPKKGEWP